MHSLLEVCPECRECQPASRRWKWLATALIPPGHGYLLNQALMDFGAQVCTPYKPICLFCPLRAQCQQWNPLPDGGVRYEE